MEQREQLVRSGILNTRYNIPINLCLAKRAANVEREDGLIGDPVKSDKFGRLDWSNSQAFVLASTAY